MDNYLEEFGKIFIKEVRDRTIDVFERKRIATPAGNRRVKRMVKR